MANTRAIGVWEDDYNFLKEQGDKAGLTVVAVLHTALELMRMRYGAGLCQHGPLVSQFPSEIESVVWLTAIDSGIATIDDAKTALWAIKHMAGDVPLRQRLAGTFEFLAEREAEQYDSMETPL